MNRILYAMSMFLVSLQAKSQREIAKLDYSVLADVNNSSISNWNVAFRQEVLSKTTTLSLYLDYLKREFDFFDVRGLRPMEEIERFHQLEFGFDCGFNLGRSYQVKVLLNPTISTTWNNPLSSDDVLWNFSSSISKIWYTQGENLQRLQIGVLRNTLFGSPELIPTITYQSEWNDTWFLRFGFPYNSIAMKLDDRNQLALEHAFLGTYTNISASMVIDGIGESIGSKLVQNGMHLTLDYTHRLQPHFKTTTKIGYQFIEEFEIQDRNENQLYDFGRDTSIFFSIGLIYNFK